MILILKVEMTNTSANAPKVKPDTVVEHCMTTPIEKWSPNLMAVFVSRIENAFYQKQKDDLVGVAGQLEALMRHVFSNVPKDVRQAVTKQSGDEQLRMAYLLGQLSFAQQFATTVAHHRPDNAFYEAVKDERAKAIMQSLASAPASQEELMTATQATNLTLQKKLTELITLGIVDFRGRICTATQGVKEYFLTPAGKQLLASAV